MFVPIKDMYSPWVSNHSNGILSHKTLQGLLCESSKAVVYVYNVINLFPFLSSSLYTLIFKELIISRGDCRTGHDMTVSPGKDHFPTKRG